MQAAQTEAVSGREQLGSALTNAIRQHPDWYGLGQRRQLCRISLKAIFRRRILYQSHHPAKKPPGRAGNVAGFAEPGRAGIAAQPRPDHHDPLFALIVGCRAGV